METKICLLIDDDPDDREVFGMAISEIDRKLKCSYAEDGTDALQQIREGKVAPAIIFLDLNMPRMNGHDCLQALKKMPQMAQTPVIIYTTSADERELNMTKKLGAADFITKPHSIKRVIDVLGTVLSKYNILE